ncbi:MAG: valine--tRNA ligase [Anaerolineae bacterium]|nr:valine--tRNA ligase [Anaerolineae bacterium]
MTKELPIDPNNMAKAYDPAQFEEPLYDWWESKGYFKPEIANESAEPFVIAMPPPNVTGALHIGHAMTAAVEDLMIRYNRMKGKAALWIPGTDHAGIATQLQVERALRAEGTSRQEIGRERFLERTWAWKEEHGGIITRQHRRLGASCDWERERFTLDAGLSRAVNEAFVRLYEKGLIYRGEYLINWSPGLQTAVSDLEVEYSEEEGKLYYFKYMLANSDDYIPVATTRPETILGDTAVAVHPDDARYQQFIGKMCVVPALGREIPVIADDYVDMEFGTGALKITPGHDPNDFEIGKRHNLAVINVMNKDATMNANAGPYQGLDRSDCRTQLWAAMEAEGLTLEVKPHRMQVPRAQRGGEIVEPMVSTQWFVRMRSLADAGLAAVDDGRIQIVPERFTKIYHNWLENIKDWCISRQLWWGHRIPAWYAPDGTFFVAHNEEEAYEKARSQFGPDVTLEQDADVLDTWFSSGLWPFSTLGWPDNTPDLQRYYPNSVMETGYDILFFWVARMIMSGLEYTGQAPFHTVYLHGIIRDETGRKMSKTTGNVIDPLEVIDQYGCDALRFTLLTGSTPGSDMNLSLDRIASNRNFGNKIWNATRFVVTNQGTAFTGGSGTWNLAGFTMPDKWILSRLSRLIGEVTRLIDNYNFGEAGRQLYDFFWSEFADWYIEIAKIRLYDTDVRAQATARRVLVHVLDRTLRMLHPFIPFVTEAAWQHLPHDGDALIVADWPAESPAAINEEAEANMAILIDVIRAIRNIRSEYDVEPGKKITALIAAGEHYAMLEKHIEIVTSLARLDEKTLTLQTAFSKKPDQTVGQVISGGIEIYLPLAGMIDVEAERERVKKDLTFLEKGIASSRGKLNNKGFVDKAPADVVERERERLADLELQLAKVEQRLKELEAMS